METKKCGKIVVITGPSGAGRTTVVEMLKNSDPNFVEPPSVTTRTQRSGEVAGEHYFFVSLDEFEQGVNNDDFIFWNQYIGNYYGLYKSTITKLLSEGKNVVLDFPLDEDIYKVKKVYPNIINIYIIPPDVDSLVRRLFARGDNVDTVKCRLDIYEETAYTALKADAIVVNKYQQPEETARSIASIVENPSCAKEYYDEYVEMVVQMKKALRFVKGDLQAWLKKEKERFDSEAQMCDEDAIADSISKSNTYIQQQVSCATQLIDDETKRLRIAFGSTWEKLLPSTQTSLISAGVLWASCAGIEDQNFDYSGICITTTCGLEAALKSVFYTGFQEYLQTKHGHPRALPADDIYTYWPEELLDTKYYVFRRILDDGEEPTVNLGDHFTMGMLPYLFYGRNPIIREKMNEYLKTILKKPDVISGKWWAINAFDRMVNIRTGERDSDSFVSRCELIREAYRNPAAHSCIVDRKTAKACSDAIVGRVEAFKHNMEVQGLLMELYSMLK